MNGASKFSQTERVVTIAMRAVMTLGCLLCAECGAIDPAEEEGPVQSTRSPIIYRNSEYIFVISGRTSWDSADATCNAQGYRLVTINDADEENFLYNEENRLGGGQWWIGLTDRGIEGLWTWAAGGQPAYTNWYPGEPNNSGNEDCVLDNWALGRWNDGKCTDYYPYICEKSLGGSVQTGTCKSYNLSNTGSATVNTSDCQVYLYAGQRLTAGVCNVSGGTYTGDTVVRVNNPYSQEVAVNDDACGPNGMGSNLSFVAQDSGSYTIRAGCFSNSQCTGMVGYSISN